jgi:DNA replicative helicase MCM subunit Mcm2 (Cdc46/Mcm family)
MATAECARCGKEFELPRQRGRPAKKCEECRNSAKTGPSVSVKVDRLEMLLRSRGQHIDQNRKD